MEELTEQIKNDYSSIKLRDYLIIKFDRHDNQQKNNKLKIFMLF